MLHMASRLPVGSVTFVVESETLYVRVQSGFRPAMVSHWCSLLAVLIVYITRWTRRVIVTATDWRDSFDVCHYSKWHCSSQSAQLLAKPSQRSFCDVCSDYATACSSCHGSVVVRSGPLRRAEL